MAERATVTFHTSPETKARLDKLATLTKRSKSFLTNAAVEQYLAAEEQFVARVEQGMKDADAGRSFGTDEALASLKERTQARAAKR